MKNTQPNNPLHGVTLEQLLKQLVAFHGWDGLGRQINIRCFTRDASIASSLAFLRRTPWARERVESLYIDTLTRGTRQPRIGCAPGSSLAPLPPVDSSLFPVPKEN